MGVKYRIHDQRELYFVTFIVIDWIGVFIRDRYREIFLTVHASASVKNAWW